MLKRLRSRVARPTVDAMREGWHGQFLEQQDLIVKLTDALEHASEVTAAARHLMSVLSQRSRGAAALFVLNDDAAPGEANILRDAILRLQARLEGSEVPEMVAIGVTKH